MLIMVVSLNFSKIVMEVLMEEGSHFDHFSRLGDKFLVTYQLGTVPRCGNLLVRVRAPIYICEREHGTKLIESLRGQIQKALYNGKQTTS